MSCARFSLPRLPAAQNSLHPLLRPQTIQKATIYTTRPPKRLPPARIELATSGLPAVTASHSLYETHVITNYTKEAIQILDLT
jgi:hypothetical protein